MGGWQSTTTSLHLPAQHACASSAFCISHICQFHAMLMTALSGDRLFTSATRTAVPCSRPDSFCALPSMRSRQLLNRASLMAGSRSSRLRQMGGGSSGPALCRMGEGSG